MKIAVYSPYLDTFGGGEKYMMTIAETFSQKGFIVDVILDNHLESFGTEYLKDELSKRFNLDLAKVNFTKGPIGKGSGFLSRTLFLKKYDGLFYLTDGSIFYPTAKNNFLHIQSPLIGQPAKSFKGKFKLKGWDLIIYNSKFTQKYSEENWPLKSEVIYPPVNVEDIKVEKKRNYILSVGRFFGYLKDKKHELLIDRFKALYKDQKIHNWSLHLVGSASKGDEQYVSGLKERAENFPIKFYPNLGYKELVDLYGESSIYWHAAGFEEDDPTKMEHFGISTVEAMAAGAVPVVIAKGGQVEIVDSKSGFLWQTLDELNRFTVELIEDKVLRDKMSKEAKLKSILFSKGVFKNKFLDLIKS